MANKKHLRKFGVNESISVRVPMWVLLYCTTARSGYLFSCLITCANGYKIGHKKQINKVLLTVRRYAAPVAVLARRATIFFRD